MKTFFTCILLTIICGITFAQSFLDPGFASAGKLIVPGTGSFSSLIVQPDQKILATCSSDIGALLIKYKENGTVDSSFGLNGVFAEPYHTALGALTLQPDGKILLGGSGQNPFYDDFLTMRLNSDGSVDNTFGIGGMVFISFGSGGDYGNALALQPDGKIIIAGDADAVTIGIARLLPDGTPDSSFATNGEYTFNTGLANGSAKAVSVMADGRIVVGGQTHASDLAFIALRLLPDGTSDTTFNHTGYASTLAGDIFNYVRDMKVQADGKIVMAGSGIFGAQASNFTLLRYNIDGSLDNAFGIGGIANIDFNGNDDDASSLIILPDDKILVGGYATVATNPDFGLVRLNSDGSIDHTFGIGGKITTAIQDSSDYPRTMAAQSDGKILLGGWSVNGQSKPVIARYLPYPAQIKEVTHIQNDIVLSPNPATDRLYINTPPGSRILNVTATNSAGVTIDMSNVQNTAISLKNIPGGVYVFRVFFDNRDPVTQKIQTF